MPVLVELVKMAALAALAGLIAAVWLAPIFAAIIGVAVLWLLVVRAA